MRIPDSQLAKRAPTQTTSSSSSTETFLDSASVVSAVSKLNDTIKELKSKIASQSGSIGALAAFMTIFLVMLLFATAVCFIRYQNRVRQSEGIAIIPHTEWMMTKLGPDSDQAEKGMEVEKITGQYDSAATPQFNNGGVDKLYSSEISQTSGSTLNPPIIGSSPLGIYSSQSATLDASRDPMSTNSSPNANRYTIDIEFDPSKTQLPTPMDGEMPKGDEYSMRHASDPYSEVSHLHLSKDQGQTHERELNPYGETGLESEGDFDYESYYQGSVTGHDDGSIQASGHDSHHGINNQSSDKSNSYISEHSQIDTRTPGIATSSHFSNENPHSMEDEEYDDFAAPPIKKFVTVSTHNSLYDGRQSVASSVYPASGARASQAPFNGFEEVKHF